MTNDYLLLIVQLVGLNTIDPITLTHSQNFTGYALPLFRLFMITMVTEYARG